MLNGLEKTLERKIPERERRWGMSEDSAVYDSNAESSHHGLAVADA